MSAISAPSAVQFNDAIGAYNAEHNAPLPVASVSSPQPRVQCHQRDVLWHRALIDYGMLPKFNSRNPNVAAIIDTITAALTTATNNLVVDNQVAVGQVNARSNTRWNLVENTMRNDNDNNNDSAKYAIVNMLLQQNGSDGFKLFNSGTISKKDVDPSVARLIPMAPGQVANNLITKVNGVPLVPPGAGRDDAIRSYVRTAFGAQLPIGNGTEILTTVPLVVVTIEDRSTLRAFPVQAVPHSFVRHSIGNNRVNGFGPFVFKRMVRVVLKHYTSIPRPANDGDVCFYYDEHGELFHDNRDPAKHAPVALEDRVRITNLNRTGIATLEQYLHDGLVDEPSYAAVAEAIKTAERSQLKAKPYSPGLLAPGMIEGQLCLCYGKFVFRGFQDQSVLAPARSNQPRPTVIFDGVPMNVFDEN